MSKNKEITSLTTDGGYILFPNTGTKFKTHTLVDKYTVSEVLNLGSAKVPPGYELVYKDKKELEKLTNFFLFYKKLSNEELDLDFSLLAVEDDSKNFLIYVDVSDDNSRLFVLGTNNWEGERIDVLTKGKYLILVKKHETTGLVSKLLAKSVDRGGELELVFKIYKSNPTLDLSDTFPEYIHGFYPLYSGTLEWGDGETTLFNGKDHLVHTYTSFPENEMQYDTDLDKENKTNGFILRTVLITDLCEGLGQVPCNCVKCTKAKGIKYFGKCFSYCREFNSFPSTFFHDIGRQVELNGCFQGTSISSIPENLFTENQSIRRIISLFSECIMLNDMESDESIVPERLFAPLRSLEELISVFDSCYHITKVHENFFKYNPKLWNISRCFALCGLDSPDEEQITPRALPQHVFDGLNLPRTEAVFSGFGLGRVYQHISDMDNPHATTLQKAYDTTIKQLQVPNISATKGFTVISDDEKGYRLGLEIDNIKNHKSQILGLDTNSGKTFGIDVDPYSEYSSLFFINGNTGNTPTGFYSGYDFNNNWTPKVWIQGLPLTLKEKAVKGDEATTLDQVRGLIIDAELNNVEIQGSWDPTTDTPATSTWEVNDCYIVDLPSNIKYFDYANIRWYPGDFALKTASGIVKYGGNGTFTKVFSNLGDETAELVSSKKVQVEGTDVFVISNTGTALLKNNEGKGLAISNGLIEITGGIPLRLSADPVEDLDAVTKGYVDVAVEKIKEWDNTGKEGKKSQWTGDNVFDGSTQLGKFCFTPKDSEYAQLSASTYGDNNSHYYCLKVSNGDKKSYTDLTVKRNDYISAEIKNTISPSFVKSNLEAYKINVDGGVSLGSETLEISTNKKEKKYSGNINVLTDKEGLENFAENEFITKSASEELVGNLLEEHLEDYKKLREDHEELSGNFNEHKDNETHVTTKSYDYRTMYATEDIETDITNLKITYFKIWGTKEYNNVSLLNDSDSESYETTGLSYSRWNMRSISFYLKNNVNVNPEGENVYLHVYMLDDENNYVFKAYCEEAVVWPTGTDGEYQWVRFEFPEIKNIQNSDKLAFSFHTSKSEDNRYNVNNFIWCSPIAYLGENNAMFSVTLSSQDNPDWCYGRTAIFKAELQPVDGISSHGLDIATLSDLESTIKSIVRDKFFPVGFVYSSVRDAKPSTWPGDTKWVRLGSSTVGTTTLYHFKREI